MVKILNRSVLAAALGLMAVVESRVGADIIVDATSSANLNSVSSFGTLDLTTGVYSQTSTLSVTVSALTSGPGGTLYGGASDGLLYTISGGVASPFGSVQASVPAGGTQVGYLGLASAGAGGFYASNLNAYDGSGTFPATLDHISPDGNSVSTVGTLYPQLTNYSSGNLAFGPGGSLYFVGSDNSGTAALFGVNTSTGVATEIGTGLGTLANNNLTIVYAGGQLYGVDTIQESGFGPISIYTIDTSTGLATATGATVSGLNFGYTLDTAAAVPEPASLTLLGIAGLVAAGYSRVCRERAARA